MRLAPALAAAAILAAPSPALGHAVLTHTTPHQGSSVQAAPERVELDFNEPVQATAGAVRVFDTDGARVDAGAVSRPGGKTESVAVGLRARLPRGIYTATYRVTSADGHPVSGGFTFGVGEAAVLPDGGGRGPAVAELLERYEAGPAVEGAYGAARGIHYGALLLLVGALTFAALVWPRGVERRWPARLLAGAAAAGAVCALASVVLQGALAAGVPLGEALRGEVIDASLETRTGDAWALRAVAWAVVLVLVVMLPARRPSRAALVALAIPAAALVASLPYAGHADTQSPKAVLIPADVLHVLAAGAWLGGLVLLLAVFWPRRGESGPVDGAATATARFSRIALPAIAVLVAVGLAQTWFYLGSVEALVTSTYGWALVAKLVLLAAVVALAAANRRRAAALATGALDGVRALRRSMLVEVGLAVLVLAATATLVRAAPPVSAAGPVVRSLDAGPLRVQLDVEPARAGPNDYHVYLFDRETGAQISRVEEVTVRLVQPDKGVGPIVLKIPRKGPAHYELLDAGLGVRGDWEAQLDVRVSEFDQYTARTKFEVR